jgi:hypothetical protein
MENMNDEKINNGVNEIKNIKMTSFEKDHILQNILNKAKPYQKPVRSPFFLFNFNYSTYLKFAVFLIIILAGGEIILSNNSNKKIAISPIQNYYKEMNPNNNDSLKTQNNDINTTENNKVVAVINKKENNNITTNQPQVTTSSVGMSAALSPSIIYKTKKDYSNNISVCYKNGEITCFPGPTDVIRQRPTKLANGYLFKKMSGDVFLDITIDEFIKYEGEWFSLIKIENIIDYNPYTEIYSCQPGLSEEEINEIILSNNIQNSCVNILNKN